MANLVVTEPPVLRILIQLAPAATFGHRSSGFCF